MPTYQDALAADPSQFLTYATEMTSAAADLAAQQTDYGARVADINVHWRDTANDAFNGEVGTVNAHLTQVIGEVTTTAGSLAAAGSQMLTECTLLKAADAALKVAGFDIQPAPMVTLGALQRTAIAMAGPFGGLIEAALQAQALAGTLGLQALTSLVNAADATAGAAVSAAADLLKPLEDKTGAGDDTSANAMAEDHSGGGGEESEEEKSKEEEEEKKEEPGKEESPQSESREPTSPESPSGMEDLAQTETPDLENPWDASELPDPDDLSGGLASGGGLGGGVGGAGLGAGGLGSGPGGAGVGAAAGLPGGAAVAGGTGPGRGGGMMGGGGGARGAGGAGDDETSRESKLIEDDDDIWGIGKAADDLYE
jgi:hypothetical protein